MFITPQLGLSQNKGKLEKKKKRIQEEIRYTNKLLKQNAKSIKLSSTQLAIINKRISFRQQLISTIRSQVRVLDKEISEKKGIIDAMDADLRAMKEEYAKMIYQAYKNRSAYDRLMFLFSAKDFNQAYKRLKYYQQYTEYRQSQAVLIKKVQEVLNKKVGDLEGQKVVKETLLSSEREEKRKLTAEKGDQQGTLKKLQTDDKRLRAEIKAKQKEAAKLQKAIEDAIRKEIEAAKKKGKYILTPEAKELMGKFEKNKGKLPWPLDKAIITGKFGNHPHEVLTYIMVNNNGIDLSTTKGAVARAVFDGTVSKVIIIPNSGKAVLVRHGEYLSVYFKLNEVFVEPGDAIKTKDDIGLVISDEVSGKTELHFEVWKGRTILNPSVWLYQAN